MEIKAIKNSHIILHNDMFDLAIPMKDKTYDYVILDQISSEVLKKIDDGLNYDDIISFFSCKYNEPREVLINDFSEVFKEFSRCGLIEDLDKSSFYAIEDIVDKGTVRTSEIINKSYYDTNTPYRVFLELTHFCNLRCKHCYLDDYKSTYIEYDQVINILNQLKASNVVELILSGGEICLYPDLIKVIEYASSRFVLTLLTNGSLITKSFIEQIKDLPIYEIQISLYGMRELHNEFVRANSWDNSIQALMRIKESMGIGKAAIVLNNQTYSDTFILIDYLKKHEIEYLVTPIINSSVNGNTRTHNFRLNSSQLRDFYSKCDKKVGGSLCTAGISRFRITPSLIVYPCELLENFPFGSLKDKSFDEILNSVERRKWINLMKNLKPDKDCIICKNKNLCPSCIGMNYMENKDFSVKNQFACLIANIQAEMGLN